MNYYERLGVAITATLEEIRKAYRRLAVQMHPDRNPHDASATEKFQKITEAYSVLIDVEKRRIYDQTIYNYKQNMNRSQNSSPFGNKPMFSDIMRQFDQMYANAQVFDITLTLEDLLVRRYKDVEVETMFSSYSFRINLLGITSGQVFSFETGNPNFPQFRIFPKINLKNQYEIYNEYDLKIRMTLSQDVFKNGSNVKIKLVEKTVVEYIDPGVPAGSFLILKDLGLFRHDGTRGDLYAEIKYS